MLRGLIEDLIGPLSDADLKEVLEMATSDIRTNNLVLNKRRTYLDEVIRQAIACQDARFRLLNMGVA